jgi:hypothetical protein
MTGQGNIGAASYSGTTRTQTDLAASLSSAELRKKRSDWTVAAWILLGIGVVLFLLVVDLPPNAGRVNPQMFAFVSLALGIAGSAFCFAVRPSEDEVHASEAQDRQMDRSWLCLRCGHIWDPTGGR